MKLNRPSYGVFMVDIFASSVGIFILVSLLYIIESAKATSDEVMAEKFKTLVKRDKVPVERYSLPHSRDPLHDWGIRAKHAREKEEALIILLRDKILLYHTMETLDKDEIIDSEAISRYYQKYSKNRRLILEIHYHDAYNSLKAKIHESLPPDVGLWIHWAYNAGNIANPNPVLGKDNTGLVNMSRAGEVPIQDGENTGGAPSSVASADSLGEGSDPFGSENGNASGSGGENGGQDGQDGDGTATDGQPDGNGQGEGDNPGQGDAGNDQPFGEETESPLDGQTTAQSPLAQEIERQMTSNMAAEQFIEEYLAPDPQEAEQTSKQQLENPLAGSKPPKTQEKEETDTPPEATETEKQDPFRHLKRDPDASDQTSDNLPSSGKPNEEGEAVEEQAEQYIKKNVFISVPLFSPINHFQLDVQVPGYTHQRYSLNAMALKLHLSPEADAQTIPLSLEHGDAIVPQPSSNEPDWIQVKIVKVANPNQAINGWVYGAVLRQVLMLPLHQNKVQSITTQSERYWFKQNNQAIEQFNTNPDGQESP